MATKTLTVSDLNFVLNRLPKDILTQLKKNPGRLYLAGGFIRSIISGEKVSDVDLFGPTKEHLLACAKDLTLERKGRYFQTDNAITVLAPPRHPIQYITRWLYDDPTRLIETFDFTVCQAIIWATVGQSPSIQGDHVYWHSLCHDDFYSDLAARRLVYTFPKREEEPGGSLMRAFKFVGKGWNIQSPSIAGVVARIAENITEEALKKGGFMGSHEKQVATVMTGLLRQVDPLNIIDGVDIALDEHEVNV